jgi:tRNA pseudouridine13 synthase
MQDGAMILPDWPRALGEPACRGLLRVRPEDFQVEELPRIEPAGEGSHLWLEIRKTNANTDWVARQLAEAAGVHTREVGYAGMKDRRAVTRQWFSVGLQEARNPDWTAWSLQDAEVLRACRHPRKLKRGILAGNRFHIRVRQLAGDQGGLEQRLAAVARQGVPNYFGPQRFGRDGQNLERGKAWLSRGGRLPRHLKGIYLSAVRAFLFNEVLGARVRQGSWNTIMPGELAALDGSRSTFRCEPADDELEHRCRAFDIHPSGPLPGRTGEEPGNSALAIENGVLQPHRELIEALQRAGVDAGRRSLRARPRDMQWQIDGDSLSLAFELSPGAYATAVLRELVSAHSATISEKT